MARIQYGPLVSEVYGSIAGVTFQHNASGAIARKRPILSHTSTIKQTGAHDAHYEWLYRWQQLTQSQRDAWQLYASVYTKLNKFGQSKKLTGLNWFETSNYWRSKIFLPQLSDPPAHTLPPSPPAFNVNASIDQFYLFIHGGWDFINTPVIVWASAPTRRNTLSINQIRKFVVIEYTDASSFIILTDPWKIAFNLNWDPAGIYKDTNIFVCIQTLHKDSGITSPFLCSKINLATIGTGVGSWAIGLDLIVILG